MMSKKSLREIPAKWNDILLVCRKCSKKVGKRFGRDGDQILEKALKAELKTAPGEGRWKVASVACLDICPKNAVCLVQASVPGKVHLVTAEAALIEVFGELAPVPQGSVKRGGKAARRAVADDAAQILGGGVASSETS